MEFCVSSLLVLSFRITNLVQLFSYLTVYLRQIFSIHLLFFCFMVLSILFVILPALRITLYSVNGYK